MIAYDHDGGSIAVGPHPDVTGWSDRYQSTVGACFLKAKTASYEANLIQMLVEFHHAWCGMACRYGQPTQRSGTSMSIERQWQQTCQSQERCSIMLSDGRCRRETGALRTRMTRASTVRLVSPRLLSEYCTVEGGKCANRGCELPQLACTRHCRNAEIADVHVIDGVPPGAVALRQNGPRRARLD